MSLTTDILGRLTGDSPDIPDNTKTDVPAETKAEVITPTLSAPPIPKLETKNLATPKHVRYEDIARATYSGERPLTPEEKAKQDKKEKREKLFSALGDGISALSNLYFASKGAPSMYEYEKGQAKATADRWEKLKEQQRKNNDRYYEIMTKARAMDDDRDEKDRQWRLQLDRLALADKRYDDEQADKAAQAKADAEWKRYVYQTGRDDKKAAAAAKEEYYKNRLEIEKVKAGRSGGGGGATKRYAVFDKDGGIVDHTYTKEEAAARTESNGGTYPRETSERSTTSTTDGLTRTTTSNGVKKITTGVSETRKEADGYRRKNDNKAPLD